MKLNYRVATVIDGWYVTTAKPARKQKERGPERMRERLAELWTAFQNDGLPQDDRLVVMQAEESERVAKLAEELTREMNKAAIMLSNGKAIIAGWTDGYGGSWRVLEIKCASQGGVDIFIDAESLLTVGKNGKGTLTIREMAHIGKGYLWVEGEKFKAVAMGIEFHQNELGEAINQALERIAE